MVDQLAQYASLVCTVPWQGYLHDVSASYKLRIYPSIRWKAHSLLSVMAEVLSIAASIAGLVSLVDVVARRIFKYAGKAKNAEKQVDGLIAEITDFYGVLNKLQLVACRFEDEKLDSTMQVYQITSCGKLLGRIRSRLRDFDANEHDGKGMGLAKKLKWPFSSSETGDLIVELGRLKATWCLALEADGM